MTLDRGALQLYPEIRGEDEEETQLLRGMAEDARAFISGHEWCPPIREFYLATGVGGVIALFLVDFAHKIEGATDDSLWLVVGDLPSAYFVTENALTPREALESYCSIMDDWVFAVLNGGDLDEVYPVDAEASATNAKSLESRLTVLRREIIPEITSVS